MVVIVQPAKNDNSTTDILRFNLLVTDSPSEFFERYRVYTYFHHPDDKYVLQNISEQAMQAVADWVMAYYEKNDIDSSTGRYALDTFEGVLRLNPESKVLQNIVVMCKMMNSNLPE